MVDLGGIEESDFDGLDETDGIAVSLTELLEQVIVGTLQAGAGPVIGKVDTYDAAAGRASVTPLVPLLVDGDVVASPKLPSVPVSWPGSASHSIRWPIGPGSFVSLEPLGHDHSQWVVSGSPDIPPTSDRRFSIADLVAKPLAPSPTANPPDPLSYDAAWGVLFGKWAGGGSDATKAVALDGDKNPADALMATWMGQVEVFINGLVPLTVSPLSTTFTAIGISAITATATKLKAK